MTCKHKVFAFVTVFVFVFAMIGSTLFLTLETQHDCSGEDCAVCHQLQACQNFLKLVAAGGTPLLFVRVCFRTGTAQISAFHNLLFLRSLVALKVKLSN